MYIGESIPIFGQSWAYISFIENNGMAFGLSIGGEYGKLALSVFRILAVGFLFYLIGRLIREKARRGVLVSFSLIAAGALGNIIDSVFYGLLFSESSYHARNVAEFLPEGGGYAGLLHGKVVDMLYFPIVEFNWPNWIPYIGGDSFLFFSPVFNIADSAICVGVVLFLFYQKSFFSQAESNKFQESAGGDTASTPEKPLNEEYTERIDG